MEFPDTSTLPGCAGLPDFGDPEANVALVGRFSSLAVPRPGRNVVRSRCAVVSGGLYAVLFNAGVKGLRWPYEGMRMSSREDQPWTEKRRFDIFKPREDKILKKIVTEKDYR
jgi:hypothetical protein